MPGIYAPGDTLGVLQIEDMACRHGSARWCTIPDGQALETDRGRSTVDRHGEGKNVVPIDEAIAHARRRLLIEPTTGDHPLRMIFTAI